MANMFNLILFFIIPFVLSKCFDNRSCRSCVRDKTWAGTSCRWCVLDRACHTTWSPKNHCIKKLNIRHPLQCDLYYRELGRGSYDQEESSKMAMFSALAYSDTPDKCLQRVFRGSDYEVVSINVQTCDDFIFDYDKQCLSFTTVSHGNKEIIVSFRGTRGIKQILDQVLMVIVIPRVPSRIGGKIQKYFQNVHRRLYHHVKMNIVSLITKFPDYTVKFTGHSLGGAAASIASAMLVWEKILTSDQIVLYTFGMPRVGDKPFAQAHDMLVPKSWRVVRRGDIVARVPFCKLGSCSRFNGPYHHQTKVLYTDYNMTVDSSYTICNGNEDTKKICRERSRWKRSILSDVTDAHKLYFGIPIGTYCKDHILKN